LVAGLRSDEKGASGTGESGLHKGNTLAESCEDADDRRFVQEKMNKVNSEVGPALLVWES